LRLQPERQKNKRDKTEQNVHVTYPCLAFPLQKQLTHLKSGMLLVNSFLLLAVLEPAMWHQWINIESANSNFYYSITLLLGAWQVEIVL